jgi:hypothetical protein
MSPHSKVVRRRRGHPRDAAERRRPKSIGLTR